MVRLNNDWDSIIGNEFNKPYYLKLREFLKEEYQNHCIYPNMHNIFSALKTTPYHRIKVVILGQDPYHGEGQAHGMCFSVLKGVPLPPSLQNIFKEIKEEYGYPIPKNGHLVPWAMQGVLLLNAVLTVRAGEANSHKDMGWEIFTDEVIKALNTREDPVVFLLWGASAKKKAELIDQSRHFCLTAAHPSPLSAHNGFFGCGHFKKANKLLISMVKSPINWQIFDE
jgi:uracil-DNA glycosylase